jgi:hypothetical protein
VTIPISNIDPYSGLPVETKPWAKVETQVTGDAQMETRTDLGTAHGGEPGDNKDWLKSLKIKHGPGKCAFCAHETERRIAVETRHIKGRIHGLPWLYWCEACQVLYDILSIRRRLADPTLHPEARERLTAQLKELEVA